MSAPMMQLAPNLKIPLDGIGRKWAIMATSGAGKTYTATMLAEQIYDVGGQFVTLDPIGNWYALRLAADGKGPGIAVPVFGGVHGDVPLEPESGELMADLIVDRNISAILDVSMFTEGEIRRFVTAFARQLLARRMRKPGPMMVFWEECQDFIPQEVFGADAPMVGATVRLVKKGRNFGVGSCLVSQQPQAVNKKVLNQSEILIALRTIGSHEKKAIRAWVEANDVDEHLIADIAKFDDGEAVVYSPAWLKLLVRVRMNTKRTYNASATPVFGGKQAGARGTLAPIDLEALRKEMADVVARAEAEDPKALRRRVVELEKELAAKPGPKVEQKRVEVPVLRAADLARLERAVEQLGKVTDKSAQAQEVVVMEVGMLREKLLVLRAPAPAAPAPRPVARPAPAPRPPAKEGAGGAVPRPQQRILDALAWYEVLGIFQPTRQALAIKCGLRVTGTYTNNLGALRTAGLIDYPQSGCVGLTAEGQKQAAPPAMQPTKESVQEAAIGVVSGPQAKILVELIGEYPDSLSREALAERLGLQVTGTFTNNLGAMRTMGLIDYPRSGQVVATDLLFPEGR